MEEKLNLLSNAERKVADLVLKGLTNKEIANELIISENTVNSHLDNVFKKLRCKKGRIGLFVMALESLKAKGDNYEFEIS